MACVNHPEVISGLDTCTACSKTFCIDCLVGRKSGWFCAACDPEPKPSAVAPPPGAPVPIPKPPKTPAARVCLNHPEVIDKLARCSQCAEWYCPDCLVQLKGNNYCAGCKVSAVKDMQSGVSASRLQLAGIGQRLLAYIIDCVVTYALTTGISMVLAIVMAAAQPDPNSVLPAVMGCGMVIVTLGGYLCYYGFMIQWKGQTLGKMALRIKVVNADGSRASAGQAWTRAVVQVLLSILCITYITAFFNDEKMAIHDMAARTRVVKVD
jgi:uncharacterized RDD family membrane protein YckC